MAQLEVVNTTSEDIAVMFDGQQVYFKPEQKKAFEEGVALGIASESKSLEVVDDSKPEEVEKPLEVTTEPSPDTEDVYKKVDGKRGIQYRKNGKIISKKEYEAR